MFIVIIFGIFTTLVILSEDGRLINFRVVSNDKIEISGIVTNIQYEDSHITYVPRYNPATKTTMLSPIYHSAQYLVTITSSEENISQTFNNQTLYENVKVGDSLQMILRKDYDKNGELINKTLEFPQ